MKPIRPKRVIEDYGDLLDIPHPTSRRHHRMTRMARAVQFAPFAALTGYEALIMETSRLTDHMVELSEEQRGELNAVLCLLAQRLPKETHIRITHFVKDPVKDGGRYETTEGDLCKIDPIRQTLMLRAGLVIHMDDIIAIDQILDGKEDDRLFDHVL